LRIQAVSTIRLTALAALFNNTTGNTNTADGYEALFYNYADNNTANGAFTLFNNTSGAGNTATGVDALLGNTTGSKNTANGSEALFSNRTGDHNTANGFEALEHNTTGSNNIALGFLAGANLTTGDNNIDIGNRGVGTDSKTIRIGTEGTQQATYIAGIREVTTQNADAIPVLIDSAGQLGTISSSRRFKKEVKPMDKASEAILALKPVTFRYKDDKTNRPQFGLIAEEVAGVNPDLIMQDKNGEIYTVRYDQVNAMLLNEFIKEHNTVQELKKEIAALTTTVNAQAALIQRVSDKLELNRLAPQVATNKQ
jgi:hypothetical protein